METKEVIPQSSLVEVDLEARFPVLFSIPQKISTFQENIVNRFDKAEAMILNKVTILPNQEARIEPERVWQFTYEDGDPVIRLFMDKIVIFSKNYKNYSGGNGENYRDFIEYGINEVLKLVKIPRFSRIGLRYINSFPMEEFTRDYFEKYFIPVYNLDRYPFEDVLESRLIMRVKRAQGNIVIQSGFAPDTSRNYLLDLDAYCENCDTKDYITYVDNLHNIISEEFKSLTTGDLRDKLGIK